MKYTKQCVCLCIFIVIIVYFYPVNKCDISISCNTGLGDLMFETFSAVTITTLSGCKHTNVIAAFMRQHGYYNLSRITSSHFTFLPKETYSWFAIPGVVLPMGNTTFSKQCGIKNDEWVSYFTGYDAALARSTLKQIAHSIKIDACASSSNIGVHSRRGDKITNKWSSVSSLEYNYRYFLKWASANHIHDISLTTDDKNWAREYSRKLKHMGIDVSYDNTNSAIDDLCMLTTAKTIIRLGTCSTFSAIASIISNKKLHTIPPNINNTKYVLEYNRNWKSVDSHWVKCGLLNIVNI